MNYLWFFAGAVIGFLLGLFAMSASLYLNEVVREYWEENKGQEREEA